MNYLINTRDVRNQNGQKGTYRRTHGGHTIVSQIPHCILKLNLYSVNNCEGKQGAEYWPTKL